MSMKRYVDNFVAPMTAELDKAKDQLIEQLKTRLVEEMEVNEKTRNNQVKLEEQLKIEKEKSATLQTEKDDLTEMLATKEEIIKVLTNGANRINNNREKDATIRQLRKENDKLRTTTGNKRRREKCNETASIEPQERCVVFGFGLNQTDMIGYSRTLPGINEDTVVEPVELKSLGEVDFVNANGKTSTIDKNGNVFLNGVKQSGLSIMAKMATSCSSHYVIDADGNLWSWGSWIFPGELGHGDTKEQKVPKLVEALKGKQVKEVISSEHCVACIAADNSCFVWGDCQRFGFSDKVTSPTKLDRSMKNIAIGNYHALMIDTNDDVYAIANNWEGELGLDDNYRRSSWTKVPKLTGRAIKVQCGDQCSAVLTTSGVFTMGANFGGATPQLVKLASVADISLRWRHILALTTSGEVYAWGYNLYGHCGVETSNDRIDVPTRVHGIEKYHIRQISAGLHNSLLRCTPKSQ